MAVARPVFPAVSNPAALLARVVEHYHRTFCQRPDAQEYLGKRGLTDADMLRAFKVGYADGSLLKLVGKSGELYDALRSLGVVTEKGTELLGGCVVVPIPDATTGDWTSIYGRGLRNDRHCYLTGPMRGVINYQAARSSSEIILTESVIDALSFHQAGIATAIPIYGTGGFKDDHMDLLTRAKVKRVILALDGDAAGRKATAQLKEKLTAAGLSVRVMPYPPNVKDANELLVAAKGKAAAVFAKCLDAAEPTAERRPEPPPAAIPYPAPALAPVPTRTTATAAPATRVAETSAGEKTADGGLVIPLGARTYTAKAFSLTTPERLRAVLRVEGGASTGASTGAPARFHVDTVDLYASRSRCEYSKRAGVAVGADASAIEGELLQVLTRLEALREQEKGTQDKPAVPVMTASERDEALALLVRSDLLEQIGRDVDALGYVGEQTNTRLLYLVSISRKLQDPLSAIVLSQSGAGKSGISEVIEKLTPPEDVVLVTRLTPQSLYYVEPGTLDHKLIVIEERNGSTEADYSVRVLQSRKMLRVFVPIKDPQTGNMRTKQFTVEARAAFVEATTRSDVNHENSTRCFELTMDESADQTRRIHERQRLMKTEWGMRIREEAHATMRRHWNAQRLLEPLPVVIPYADKLTFPTAWMRTRRDNARFLNLIEVSAFVHQYQRERLAGAIVASLADYEVAYTLSRTVFEGILCDLKAPLARALSRIRALAEERGGTVSRREIRQALSQPDSTVRGWLSELVELEYLETEASRGGAGKATRYRLVERDEAAAIALGLLTPDELRKLVNR